MNEEARSEVIASRVTRRERQLFGAAACYRSRTVSELLRELVLCEVREISPELAGELEQPVPVLDDGERDGHSGA